MLFKFPQLVVLLASWLSIARAVELTGYEYIVVGSGPGGGPVAARLALAGHKTLLIEAGDDQGANSNYTVPAYNAKSSEDEHLSWNFFVRHYADDKRQALDYKTSYQTRDGGLYTGLNPPSGSKMKGTLYPRTATLGGCSAHNAMITIYPHQSDFEFLASLTGDSSWSPSNMRKYFAKLERNRYLLPGLPGHGYNGWFQTETAPLTLVLEDPQLLSILLGAGAALGTATKGLFKPLTDLVTLLAGDANADSELRDTDPGYYQIPLASDGGQRNGPREFVVAVRDAKNLDGSKKYPLDVRTDCFVTKVLFDESVSPPRATGVEFLDGKYLYRASPLSRNAGSGIKGSASASREVIISGGAYNSPQLLKLSGIGPSGELRKFGIKVIKNLPGVGTNLQDHYEISVQGTVPTDFAVLRGCTFDGDEDTDACLKQWMNPILGNRGTYVTSGMAAGMLYKSSTSPDGSYDVFGFGGPVNFRGYFPGYSVNATANHNYFSWALLKAHPRNTAGSVTLRSADPLDMPNIVYNYFDTGVGDYDADLQAMYEAIGVARNAFKSQLVPVEEVLPGIDFQSVDAVKGYVKDNAWGHHASSTCPIGADGDSMAVLDSSFRVRGVQGLRVVDASVYPRIPGTFTAVSTYMVAEKAADVILSQIED